MLHKEKCILAGKVLTIKKAVVHPQVPNFGGSKFEVEDWWDRVHGKSWMDCAGNPACLVYAMRSGFTGLPIDDEVVYGKLNGMGHLLHISEFEEYNGVTYGNK